MKKFLSFALALAMTASLVPATAFAATDARVSNTVTAKEDTELTTDNAPILTLQVSDTFDRGDQEFRVKLENAEWLDAANLEADITVGGKLVDLTDPDAPADVDIAGGNVTVETQKQSDTTVIVKVLVPDKHVLKEDATIKIPLLAKLTGGVATVSVDSSDSEFSDVTKTFAKTSDGSTTAYAEDTTNFYDGDAIKDFFIEENVVNTFVAGSEITLKVNGGFKFVEEATINVEQVKGDFLYDDAKDDTAKGTKYLKINPSKIKDDEITITLPDAAVGHADADKQKVGFVASKNKAALIAIRGIKITEDGASNGDVAKITVSGTKGISRQTIEVGTMVDYGVTFEAAKKELPVIYAGSTTSTSSDNETLKIKIKETVVDSLVDGRKLQLVMPKGVEVIGVSDEKGATFKPNSDGDKVDLTWTPSTSKHTFEAVLDIATAADFTGDVEVTLTGAAIGKDELKATIATVKAPIEVKTAINEVAIDYRNTAINDITIVEPEAGAWKKGDKILLAMKDDYIDFEDGAKAEVVKGDMKLEDIDVKNGTITLEVKSTSSKEAAEIKISNLQLYLHRSLAAGDYALKVQGISNVDADGKITNKGNKSFLNNYLVTDSAAGVFDTNGITVMKDFVKVVTAGRDMDNSFTTKITVPVGADKILAGTKEIPVDSPAYINKDGYTMLPVRAVTEALNGVAIVRWDDATKTATISFGSRVFSMTVGSKTMNMNGVPTNLVAAPEIKNSRIFLPLRDLGYALGLNNDKIAWDAATSTATLN